MSVRGAGVSKDAAVKAGATKKAMTGITDFYRFQKKEKARNGACMRLLADSSHTHGTALLELQRKFEEDKHRIQQLKALRNFKPS